MLSGIRRPGWHADQVFPFGIPFPLASQEFVNSPRKLSAAAASILAASRHLSSNETGSGGSFLLGSILGPLGSILGSSWRILGPSWSILGPLGPILGASWGKLRPFWLQNWSKIGPKSIKNRKHIDSKTNFEFDVMFGMIFDQILINFEAKMEANFDESLAQLVTYAKSNFEQLSQRFEAFHVSGRLRNRRNFASKSCVKRCRM